MCVRLLRYNTAVSCSLCFQTVVALPHRLGYLLISHSHLKPLYILNPPQSSHRISTHNLALWVSLTLPFLTLPSLTLPSNSLTQGGGQYGDGIGLGKGEGLSWVSSLA
jgi:hypothetical protein